MNDNGKNASAPPDGDVVLDRESTLILEQLQGALDDVELEHSNSDVSRKNDHMIECDNNSDDDEGDPASGETELAFLMDSLVAELQADLHEQVLHSYTQKKELNEEEIAHVDGAEHLTIPTQYSTSQIAMHNVIDEMDSFSKKALQKIDCTCSVEPAFAKDANVPINPVWITPNKEGDPDYVPVSDHSKAGAPLDPTKKELLRRLLHYIDTRGGETKPIRAKLLQYQHEQRQSPLRSSKDAATNKNSMGAPAIAQIREDRVFQEVPDLLSSPTDVQFESLDLATAEDADYVVVQDFSTNISRIQPKKNQSRRQHKSSTKQNLQPQPQKPNKSPRSNSSKRRTRKHKQKWQPSLMDRKDSNSSSQFISKNTSWTSRGTKETESDATSLILPSTPYVELGGIGDDTIRRIANGETWRKICQIVFRSPKQR